LLCCAQCNHPDLFQPRPIISPFDTVRPLLFTVPSVATTALQRQPLSDFEPADHGLLFATPSVESLYVAMPEPISATSASSSASAASSSSSAAASASVSVDAKAASASSSTSRAGSGGRWPRSPPQWPRPTARAPISLCEELSPSKAALEGIGAGATTSPVLPLSATGGSDKYSELWGDILAVHEQERQQRAARRARLNALRCSQRPQFGAQLLALLARAHRSGRHSRVWHVHELYGEGAAVRDPFASGAVVLDAVQLPVRRFKESEQLLKLFVCIIPKARAPPIELHCSHPEPSVQVRATAWQRAVESEVRREARIGLLHEVVVRQKLNFPDKRLMQWDCGKLQMLDKLLRQLKAGNHRVLLFTQMTKMVQPHHPPMFSVCLAPACAYLSHVAL
jgi:hypothetical protein